MFWYKDFLCCFFHFHFVRISSDFSSGALWQNVLPQDFATNSFVRISLGFRQNLNWSNEIFDEILTIFFCGKMLWQKISSKPSILTIFSLWQNVLPQHFATKKNRQNFVKQFVQISSNLSWSNEIFDEISTKFSRSFFVAKGVAKWIATRIATKSWTKALTNSQRPTDVIPFLLQIMSSTNTIYIHIIYICIHIIYIIYIYTYHIYINSSLITPPRPPCARCLLELLGAEPGEIRLDLQRGKATARSASERPPQTNV